MSIISEPLVFFDIDTQVDFMSPHGKLYVPGAEQIVPNLRRLMKWAREYEVPVISSADAHSPDDPEFQSWPPHCVSGTPGQQRIAETRFAAPVVIPCRPNSFPPPPHWAGQYIVEKTAYSIAGNPNFDAILHALGPRRAVVFGVATEYCVCASALALRQKGLAVDLVSDAIMPITAEGGRRALAEMAASSVRMVTTAEVCAVPPQAPE